MRAKNWAPKPSNGTKAYTTIATTITTIRKLVPQRDAKSRTAARSGR